MGSTHRWITAIVVVLLLLPAVGSLLLPAQSRRIDAPPESIALPERLTKPGECVAGCAAVKGATTPLSGDEIRRALELLGSEEVGVPSAALETLLFHGRQVAQYLDEFGPAPLDDKRSQFLRQELGRSRAVVTLRVRDSTQCRIKMRETVPIGIKQHLHPQTVHDVSAPEISFTVQRVGLHYLWTRI